MPESEIVERLLPLYNFFLAFTHANKRAGFLRRLNIWRGLSCKLFCNAVNLNWSFF